jgi:soluble lytic murein transglycosylase-like protein
MTRTSIGAAILVIGAYLALSAPSTAQITTNVDAGGKVVYVNQDSSAGMTRGTMGAPQARPQRFNRSAASSASLVTAGAPDEKLDSIIRAAAERHQLDPALVKAVIRTESGWNPMAVSRKGAQGLMQLIPSTAQRFGVGNAFDPSQNIEGGTTYLRELLDRYHGDLSKSLAAYNAGERAVDTSGGIPAYPETERYVEKVTDAYFGPGSGRDPSLWSAPKAPVRKEVLPNGQIVFTNE